ncbi:predicted protein [Sclerotinia sclerotiorum 1980 UF-70]|uniref:Uncharacterized protein n=1 Tax=Sclerotinia sclerotiorum (strain ATCC 18683 / 1980 / Ss-1) TaxID=665079 RepID=A7ESJ5_SCLS1|nr:predicted protein [Sclerotinia sclerotiorum 1980 UF-70]EDN92437.1 predicted protein [Sclerotinia sclerotiorum 1980 UF-70]
MAAYDIILCCDYHSALRQVGLLLRRSINGSLLTTKTAPDTRKYEGKHDMYTLPSLVVQPEGLSILNSFEGFEALGRDWIYSNNQNILEDL